MILDILKQVEVWRIWQGSLSKIFVRSEWPLLKSKAQMKTEILKQSWLTHLTHAWHFLVNFLTHLTWTLYIQKPITSRFSIGGFSSSELNSPGISEFNSELEEPPSEKQKVMGFWMYKVQVRLVTIKSRQRS